METELGLLGWQQAEYDEHTQGEVEKVKNFEREQSRLNNESAQLARQIGELNAQREKTRSDYAEHRVEMDARLQAQRAEVRQREEEVAALRETMRELERRGPQLERELREVAGLQTELLKAEPLTPDQHDELTRLRIRSQALPGEIGEVQSRLATTTAESDALRQLLEFAEQKAAELEKHLRELDSSHGDLDKQLGGEIKAKENEKARTEKEIDRFEHQKSNPYQRIGQVLADANLAPMNQPNALQVVREARLRIQEMQHEIAKSQAESDAQDRALVQNSMILWAALILAATLLLATISR